MQPAEDAGEHDRHDQSAGAERQRVRRLAEIEIADATHQKVPDDDVDEPQRTFDVDDDSPTPGGEANGLWNGFPETPFTKCGIAFARNAPAKKYAR